MAEFTDRITKILNRGSPQDDRNVAGFRSLGGYSKFGDELTRLQQANRQKNMDLIGVLTQGKGVELQERAADRADEQFDYQKENSAASAAFEREKFTFEKQKALYEVLQKAAERGDKNSAQLLSWMKDFVPPSQHGKIAGAVKDLEDEGMLEGGSVFNHLDAIIKKSGVKPTGKPRTVNGAVLGIIAEGGTVPGYEFITKDMAQRASDRLSAVETFSIEMPDGTKIRTTKGQAGKEGIDTRDSIIQISKLHAGIDSLKRVLAKGGDKILGLSGSLSKGIDTLGAQAVAMASTFGFDIPDMSDVLFPKNSETSKLSAVAQSKIRDLSYVVMRVRHEQTGRGTSDADIKNSLKILAAKSGTVDQMVAALDSLIDDATEGFQIAHVAKTNKRFDIDAFLKKSGIETGNDKKNELPPLTPGMIPELGKSYTLPDGRVGTARKGGIEVVE